MSASIVLGPLVVRLCGDPSISDFRSAMDAVEEYAIRGGATQGHEDVRGSIEISLEPDWTTLGSRISAAAIDRIPIGSGSEAVTASTDGATLSHWILLGRQTAERGPHHFMSRLFYPAAARFLLFYGVHTLHAGLARLPAPESAVLVSGPCGSGKTTAMMALADGGARILSDDLTVVAGRGPGLLGQGSPCHKSARGATSRAWGIPEPVIMKKGRVLGCGASDGEGFWLSGGSVENPRNARLCNGTGRVSIIVFPVPGGTGRKIRRLNPAESTYRLMNQGGPGPEGGSPLGSCGAAIQETFAAERLDVLSEVAANAVTLEIPWNTWTIETKGTGGDSLGPPSLTRLIETYLPALGL